MQDDIPELKEMYHSPRHFQDRFQQLPENQRPPFTWLFVGPCGVQTPLHVDIWCACSGLVCAECLWLTLLLRHCKRVLGDWHRTCVSCRPLACGVESVRSQHHMGELLP